MPAPEEWLPFCREEAEQLSRTASPVTGNHHGLQRAYRAFGPARSSAHDFKARAAVPPSLRPVPWGRGPLGAASDADLVGHIDRALADSPFTGEGRRKVRVR